MVCRKCGACCIALSISSDIPDMPGGKPAGIPCAQLTSDGLCAVFGRPERPDVCTRFMPAPDSCGGSFEEALELMEKLEEYTRPVRLDG